MRSWTYGVDRGFLYLTDGLGVPWPGLVSVSEQPNGGETKHTFIDGQKVQQTQSLEEFAATIEAYHSPPEFDQFDGANGLYFGGRLPTFGLSYRVMTEGGYKIHLVYNATAGPSDKDYISNSTEVAVDTLSWEVSVKPQPVRTERRVAHLVIDSRITWPEALQAIETILYGLGDSDARLPSPVEVLDIFEENAKFKITLYPDGIFTAEGPDDAVQMLDDTTFQLNWPSVTMIDDVTYTAKSW